MTDPTDVIESGLDIYLSPVYTTDSFYYQSFAWAWRWFCSVAIKVSCSVGFAWAWRWFCSVAIKVSCSVGSIYSNSTK